jgi:fumarate hydratase class II
MNDHHHQPAAVPDELIDVYRLIFDHLLPRVQGLRDTLQRKSQQFGDGATLGCAQASKAAAPGQCLSALRMQLDEGLGALREHLGRSHTVLETSGRLRQLAVSLMTVAGSMRVLSCGGQPGIGELDATQAEALTMACAWAMAVDAAIRTAGLCEPEAPKSALVALLLMAARLLGDACAAFDHDGVACLEPNRAATVWHLEHSATLVTALNARIDRGCAERIAAKAGAENKTVCEVAVELGLLTEEQHAQWIRTRDALAHPGRAPAPAQPSERRT